jgi:hypothetical protein
MPSKPMPVHFNSLRNTRFVVVAENLKRGNTVEADLLNENPGL